MGAVYIPICDLTPEQAEERRAANRQKDADRMAKALEDYAKLAPVLAQANPSFDPVLDIYVSGHYTGRHPQTLREEVRLRRLACCRGGKHGPMLFKLSHLNAWLKRQEQRAARHTEPEA